jgi:uncharacterized membrane protein YphA (DoxX/SURF4 family)
MTHTNTIADWVLRIGVAFAFLYPPFNALGDPNSWIGYFPSFVHGIVPDMLLLHAFGIIEVVLALWILSGKYIFWPAAIATVMLVVIVAFNLPGFQVLFRDLTIAAAALALALMHWPHKKPTTDYLQPTT